MLYSSRLIAGAAVAAAAVAFVAPLPAVRAADEPAKTAAGQPAAHPLGLPAGIQVKDLNEANDIRSAFEAVTEASFNKDVFDKVTDRLVDADRDRVGKFTDKDKDANKDLEARVLVLQKQWKDKYGKDFDLDPKVVFGTSGYVAIAQGEITDPAKLIGHWPLAPVAPGQGEAQSAAAHESGAGKSAPADTAQQIRDAGKAAGGKTNLDKGRNVAVARYPAGHNMPELTLSLIHEAPDIWRFDIPDNVDGRKLHDNLLQQLNALGDGSKWPTDVNDAYRMVAHHVLMALYDVHEQPHESSK